jgi:hypothetical protein
MKIGVFTLFNSSYKPVSDITLPNLQEYCDRHGYELTPYENPPIIRDIVWDRIDVILSNLHKYDWMVYFDSDVLVTNHHIPLTEFLQNDIILSESIREDGSTHPNDGVLFVRNCQESIDILKRAWDLAHYPDIFCAQDALEYLWNHYSAGICIAAQKRFNSFLYSEYGMPITTRGHWTIGDFALHLPGRTTARRVEIFNNTEIIK